MSRPSPTGNVRSGSPRRRARSEAHGRPGTRGTPAGVVRAPVDRRPRAGTTTWSRRRAGPLASVACPRGRGAAISRGTGSFAALTAPDSLVHPFGRHEPAAAVAVIGPDLRAAVGAAMLARHAFMANHFALRV